ncbi:MAG: chalcone isomerase family protein [Gammaproteobacteria bacterium]|nr:chalcone isomerase family protein [Gammaproteobacteria bacterium]
MRATKLIALVSLAFASFMVAERALAYAQTMQWNGATIELKGSGEAHYLGFIDVYEAALYGKPGVAARQLLTRDVPMCLRLDYQRAVSREDIVKAAETVLKRQNEASALEPLRARIDRFHAAYVDVGDDDHYVLCYAPDAGSELALNGKTVVRIKGRDFAAHYFALWLGEQPLSESLKEALLSE